MLALQVSIAYTGIELTVKAEKLSWQGSHPAQRRRRWSRCSQWFLNANRVQFEPEWSRRMIRAFGYATSTQSRLKSELSRSHNFDALEVLTGCPKVIHNKKKGPNRELNPGPRAPKARIIRLDHSGSN